MQLQNAKVNLHFAIKALLWRFFTHFNGVFLSLKVGTLPAICILTL